MSKLILPAYLEDKILEIKYDLNNVSKIISYFPFSESEKNEINSIMNMDFDDFHSIFDDVVFDDVVSDDVVSDEEWNKSKEQIKERFYDELFDIDKKI